MARKIIPLKTKKSSPVKFGIDSYGNVTDVLGIPTMFGAGKTDLEQQFAKHKQNLIGMEVGQNFYADLANPFAGLTDQAASLENTMEDLTINQRAFQEQQRTFSQGLSDVLQASKQRGMGGGTAQSIANELLKGTSKMSADIGLQERQNELARAGEASSLQKLKAQSAQQLQMQKAQGQFQVDMQMRKGQEDALSRQLNKQQALLSLISGEIAREDQQEWREKGWLSKILNIF
tara:strand:- start:1878 stop:2576 length:699 start_codon:yes stop_codon:yes gene_type:complete